MEANRFEAAYEEDYIAQRMSPLEKNLGKEESGGGGAQLVLNSLGDLLSAAWEWLATAWTYLATWATFLWQTAVVAVCLMAVLVACCLCYSLYQTVANCYCPPLATFSCLCPWLSLKALKRRFALLAEPGRLRTPATRTGLPPVLVQPAYPPTEVERALIERIAALLREQVPEVGDGV